VLTQDCKVVWYGKLKLDDKTTPVIFDPLLVPSIKGCIYLYHSERDAIVQYTWKIVQGLLVDADKVEKTAIKKSYDAKWKAARKRFTKDKINTLTSDYKAPVFAPPTATADNRWDATDEDSFELDDMG
jgi:hypothetical protein